MGDVAKWVILVAGIIMLVAMVVAFPIMSGINPSVFAQGITVIIDIAATVFQYGRGAVNLFLSPWARNLLSALMLWLVGKPVVTMSFKILVWVYHYIFK